VRDLPGLGDDDLQHDKQDNWHGPPAHERTEAEACRETDDQIELEPERGAGQGTGRRSRSSWPCRALEESGREAGHGEADSGWRKQNGESGRDTGQVERAP
jgi:hypothetical protein